MENYADKYKEWLNSDFIDAEDRKELESIKNDMKEIVSKYDGMLNTLGINKI